MSERQPEKNGETDFVRIALATAAVALSILGQVLLHTTPIDNTVVLPTAAWVGIIAIVLFGLAYLRRPIPIPQKLLSLLANKGQWLWLFSGFFLSVMATIASILFERYVLDNFVPVVSLWLMGAFCYLMAFAPQQISGFDWKKWLFAHRTELFTLAAIVLLAGYLRFDSLGEYPRVIDGDEGRIGEFAQATQSGRLANPFSLWENIGALYMQAINISINLFGATPFALRLLPAIAGTLAIISIYLLARQIGGREVALLAAILLAISHTHIHFSRTSAVSYIQGTWLIPLEMYFFLSGLEKRSLWRAGLGGVLLAIHMQIYLSAQIMAGIFLVYSLIGLLFFKSSLRAAWRQTLAFWGGFLLTFMPGLTYILRHQDEFLSRMNAEGSFNSGWMAKEILTTGKSSAQILFERVIHAFLSLIYYPTIDFYGSSTPMMSLVSGALFLIGLSYALVKTGSPRFLLLNGYFWGATVAIGIFAIPPSADSYRMLIALPAAIIMAATGLVQFLQKIGAGWHRRPWHHAAIITVVIANLFIFNIYTYYIDFLGQCRFGGDRQTRFASYLGNYVRTAEEEVKIYMLSDQIFRYGSHGSVDFLSSKRPIINYPESLDTLRPVSREIIIASPNRIDELREWVREYPGGQLHAEYDCDNIILLSYQLP